MKSPAAVVEADTSPVSDVNETPIPPSAVARTPGSIDTLMLPESLCASMPDDTPVTLPCEATVTLPEPVELTAMPVWPDTTAEVTETSPPADKA